MTSKHVWQVANAGVMIWQPATTETTSDSSPEEAPEPWHILTKEDIRDSLGSSHDDKEELILPSIEELSFAAHPKDEPVQRLYISPLSSSLTACSDEGGQTQDTSSPTRARSVSSSTSSNLLCGIELYGQSQPPVRLTHEQDIAQLPQSPSSSVSSDSDRTHYEFAASSPCPNREGNFESDMRTFRDTTDFVPQAADPCGRAALIALRSLERDKPHHWDEEERELLIVLHRWYHDATPTSISQVFNAVTGLQLSHRIVRNQFKNYILLYGGRAFPEYQRVMGIPFHDPRGEYRDIRDIIDKTAIEFGIDVPRRMFETKEGAGKTPRN
ncbi:hypothetical protein PTT_14778 [Pyrenophora teres f. teres 0-1]|uniref:Uncharacterized protein n=1 Tax=Pyrenophora teres f. teres (strain 0-1) TaxID=861557 RepID=E3RYV5_PYRTT|nr:hypothetical protein PTT_14778 [Pyrenophora teres f. teres 0-1]